VCVCMCVYMCVYVCVCVCMSVNEYDQVGLLLYNHNDCLFVSLALQPSAGYALFLHEEAIARATDGRTPWDE
jgi:hypothetical protein